MSFETAFRTIFNAGYEIDPVCNCDYLYEIEGFDNCFTEEEIIKFAENM